MFEKRTRAAWINGAMGIAGACAIILAASFFVGAVVRGAPPTPQRIVVITIAAAAAMAWMVFFMRRMFLGMDEFQQQGARVAWYWGGAVGLAVSSPLYAFIGLGGLHWLWPAQFHLGADLYRAFVIGYMLPIVCQVSIAFGVNLWWRTSRR